MSNLLGLASAEFAILLALIALSAGLIKVIEILVKKYMPKKNVLSTEEFNTIVDTYDKVETIQTEIDRYAVISEKEHKWIETLYDLHNKTDADGIPLWYVPRSFIDSQKEITHILGEVSSHQEKTTYILESLLKRIEKIEDKLDKDE